MFEWKEGIKSEVAKYFSPPNSAKPLLAPQYNPIYTEKVAGHCVNKMVPWGQQLNEIIQK